MTAPAPPPPVPVAPSPPNRTVLVIVIAILVVVLIAGVTTVVVLSGDDKAAAADVSLQSSLEPGPDPYTPSVATPPPTSTSTSSTSSPSSTSSSSSTTSQLSVPPASGAGVRSYAGGQPGLYGGTRDHHSCDADLMLDYLDKNPSKKAAWASVQSIAVSEVRTYVSKLTSVLLRTDTWVTNHGYANGRSTTISSVLQAGTAVLVDSYGVPRVKCFCGNPLTPQVRYDYTPRYIGTRWAGFDPRTVVVIQQNTTIINELTLIDIYTGDPFKRRIDDGKDRDATTTTTTSTTSTTSTTTTQPPTTQPPTTPPPTQPPPTQPPPTQPPGVSAEGMWNLSGRYNISADGNTGSAGWDAIFNVSSGNTAAGEGSGRAQVDGGCFNQSTRVKVADWHAEISFRIAITGTHNGQGRLNLGVQKTSASLDSLTYSTEAPPEVADCRAQAQAGYQQFVSDLLGAVSIDARSGAAGRIGTAELPGSVNINR